MEWTTHPTEPGFYWGSNWKWTHPDDRGVVRLIKRFSPITGKEFLALVDLDDLHRTNNGEDWYDDVNPEKQNVNSRLIIGRKVDWEENYELQLNGPIPRPKKEDAWSEEVPTEKGYYWIYNTNAYYKIPWIGHIYKLFNQWTGEPNMVLVGFDGAGMFEGESVYDPMDNNPDRNKRRIVGTVLDGNHPYKFLPVTDFPEEAPGRY